MILPRPLNAPSYPLMLPDARFLHHITPLVSPPTAILIPFVSETGRAQSKIRAYMTEDNESKPYEPRAVGRVFQCVDLGIGDVALAYSMILACTEVVTDFCKTSISQDSITESPSPSFSILTVRLMLLK